MQRACNAACGRCSFQQSPPPPPLTPLPCAFSLCSPVGTAQPDEGQRDCTACSRGFFADVKGLPTCKSCSEGSYSSETGATGCTLCEAGSAQELSEQSSCELCLQGKYTDTRGQSTCKNCEAGSYADVLGLTQCKTCELGTYIDVPGALSCKGCTAGTYADSKGLTACKGACLLHRRPPPPGRGARVAACNPALPLNALSPLPPAPPPAHAHPDCDEGSFQDASGQAGCKLCEAGLFTNTKGATRCEECSAGTYQDQRGRTGCKDCQAGKYQDAKGRPACIDCPSNQYQPEEGKDRCLGLTNCPAGFEVDVPATPTSDRTCASCPAGKYAPSANTPDCLDCPEGFTTLAGGQSNCVSLNELTNCKAGEFIAEPASQGNVAVCAACPAGKFSGSPNQAQCQDWTVCPAGTRVEGAPPTPTSDRACANCPAGTAAAGPNAPSCAPCDPLAGFYQNVPQQASCKTVSTCPPGTFVGTDPTTTSNAQCINCPAGAYSSAPNLDSCTTATTCVAGQYITRALTPTADRQCGDCQSGVTYTAAQNSPECLPVTPCAVGEGVAQLPTASRDRVCAPCSVGQTYSDTRDGAACKLVSDCKAGEEQSQAPTAARDRVCRTCAPGFFKPSPGSQETCQQASSCADLEVEVVPVTPTADRQCQAEQRCENGVNLDVADGEDTSCTCPGGAACTACIVQEDREGYRLARLDAIPRSTPVDPAQECEQIPLQGANPASLDLVTPCYDRCSNSSACTAFFVFTEGPAAGLCCLKSGYQNRDYSPAVGGQFYAMVGCATCAGGFLQEGLTCTPRAEPPVFDTAPPARVTAPQTLAAGTTLADLEASSRGGFDPVTFTILSSSGANPAAFEMNATTGVLTLRSALASPGATTLRVQAMDARETCTRLVGNTVETLQGGCRLAIDIVVDVAAFINCPESFVHYLPPTGTTAQLTWTTPSLGNAFGDVAVDVNLAGGSGPRGLDGPFTLPVGLTEVTYTAEALDVGAALTCAFSVRVLNGFSLSATTIGHIAGTGTAFDFILDGDEVSGGGLAVPRFQGTVLGRTFALGIQAPSDRPFYFSIREAYFARIRVELAWCVDAANGQVPAPTSPNFALAPAGITLTGLPDLAFTDLGSGVSLDGSCFRVAAVSEKITGRASFTSLDISLDLTDVEASGTGDPERRRRRRNTLDYFPAPGSIAGAQYSAVDPASTPIGPGSNDPGAMLLLEDLVPPVWFGCPLQPIHVTAAVGSPSAEAFWNAPTATDNVAVASQSQTAEPGDSFSVVDSPHTVTYTAVDTAGLVSRCSFQVDVDFIPSAQVVDAETDDIFTPRLRTIPLIASDEAAYDLVNPFSAGLSFSTDLTNLTRLVIRIAAPPGDRVLVRTPATANSIQFEVDYRWTIDEPAAAAPVAEADVQVELRFEDFALDTSPGAADVGGASASITPDQTLTTAQAAVDPVTGYITLDAKSAPFRRGFSFSAAVLTLNFPAGRSGAAVPRTLPEGYFPTQDSTLGFRFYYDTDSTPPLAELTAEPELILLDTVAPTLQFCPSDINATVASTSDGVNVSWPEAVFTDNRPGLQLSATATPGQRFPLLPPADPPASVVYTARDSFGNERQCSFTVRVQDRTAPTLSCAAPTSVVLAPGARLATLSEDDWAPPVLAENSPFPVTTLAPSGDLVRGVGVHPYEVRVADVYGNVASCQSSFTVVDEEAPALVCPDVNPVLGAADGTGAEVRWTLLPPTDNDAVARVNLTAASGSRFLPGTTKVDVRVEDRSGNVANCTFAVVVESQSSATSSSAASASVMGGAGGGGAVALLLLIVMAVLLRRAQIRNRTPQDWDDIFKLIDQLNGRSEEDGIVVPREISRSSVELLDELGRGAFGLVYKGIMREVASMPGYLVAVKSLHSSAGGSDRQELLEEAAIMAQFSHKNVVSLVGVVTVGKPLLVVLEFMEHGSLKGYLEKNDVDEKTKVLFAGDVAAGLDHVHSKGFVHRDVAARNILIDSSRRCKVADFGLARDTAEDTYYRSRGGQLPVRWSAPEALEDRKFNMATDVWAFGVTAYEIWTKAATPYEGWHNQKVWVQVSAGYRLPLPAGCEQDVYETMLSCWEADGHKRPTFATLVRFFRDRYASLNDGVALDAEYLSLGDEAEEDAPKAGLMRRTVSTLMKRLSFGGMRATTNPGYRKSESENKYLAPVQRRDGDSAMYDLGGDEQPDAGGRTAAAGRDGELYDLGGEAPVTLPPLSSPGASASDLYDFGNTDPAETSFDEPPAQATKAVGGNAKAKGARASGTIVETVKEEEENDVDEEESFGFGQDVARDAGGIGSAPLSLSASLLDLMEREKREDSVAASRSHTPTALGKTVATASPPAEPELYGNIDTGHRAEAPAASLISAEHIGRRVRVQGYCDGVLRFAGVHVTKGGPRCGVELDEPIGLNNGVVGGHEYFQCTKNVEDGQKYGVLVIPNKVELIADVASV